MLAKPSVRYRKTVNAVDRFGHRMAVNAQQYAVLVTNVDQPCYPEFMHLRCARCSARGGAQDAAAACIACVCVCVCALCVLRKNTTKKQLHARRMYHDVHDVTKILPANSKKKSHTKKNKLKEQNQQIKSTHKKHTPPPATTTYTNSTPIPGAHTCGSLAPEALPPPVKYELQVSEMERGGVRGRLPATCMCTGCCKTTRTMTDSPHRAVFWWDLTMHVVAKKL